MERRDARSREEVRERIRAEFNEMAGMSLTPQQGYRLFDVDPASGGRVLDELVRRGTHGGCRTEASVAVDVSAGRPASGETLGARSVPSPSPKAASPAPSKCACGRWRCAADKENRVGGGLTCGRAVGRDWRRWRQVPSPRPAWPRGFGTLRARPASGHRSGRTRSAPRPECRPPHWVATPEACGSALTRQPPGMPMSLITTSGLARRRASNASDADAAVVTTASQCCSSSFNRARVSGSSSTTSTWTPPKFTR